MAWILPDAKLSATCSLLLVIRVTFIVFEIRHLFEVPDLFEVFHRLFLLRSIIRIKQSAFSPVSLGKPTVPLSLNFDQCVCTSM